MTTFAELGKKYPSKGGQYSDSLLFWHTNPKSLVRLIGEPVRIMIHSSQNAEGRWVKYLCTSHRYTEPTSHSCRYDDESEPYTADMILLRNRTKGRFEVALLPYKLSKAITAIEKDDPGCCTRLKHGYDIAIYPNKIDDKYEYVVKKLKKTTILVAELRGKHIPEFSEIFENKIQPSWFRMPQLPGVHHVKEIEHKHKHKKKSVTPATTNAADDAELDDGVPF